MDGRIMSNADNVISIHKNEPHTVREVICVKCHKRWISVAPESLLLKDYECPNCGFSETVIATGQPIILEE